MHRVLAKLPRDGWTAKVEELPDHLRSRFPDVKTSSCLVTFTLGENRRVTIAGFRMPFANPRHPCEGWLNRDELMVDDATFGRAALLDILQQRTLRLILQNGSSDTQKRLDALLPPRFSYPYGTEHSWDLDRYKKQYDEIKGEEFSVAWNFEGDNDHLAVVAQTHIQDVMWLYVAAAEIRKTKVSVYFVPLAQRPNVFYVVVPLTKEFRERYMAEWHRLTRTEVFRLALFKTWASEKPEGDWDAKIVARPEKIDELRAQHPVTDNEVVLVVRRPLPVQKNRGPDFDVITFADRSTANRVLKSGDGKEH